MEAQVQQLQALLQTERARRATIEMLCQVCVVLSSTLDYTKIINTILEQIGQILPHDAANMMVIEAGDIARVYYGRGYERFGTAQSLTATTLNVQQVPGLWEMYQTGQPLVIPDVTQDKDWVYSRPEHTWIKSYVGAPILLHGRVIGFLSVLSTTPNFYTQPDGERLVAFTHHAAIAFYNAQLYTQAQEELAERRKVEAALRQYQEHLEELVAERTAALRATVAETQRLNQQLEHEIAERGKLINDLEAFTHTVAHDLKNPLGVVMGYASLAALKLQECEDAEAQGFITIIQNTGEKMDRIITELLTFARLRQDAITPVPLDMSVVIGEVEMRLAHSFAQYQAEFSKPAAWPLTLGHAPWVEEVWVNYISNALKYGGSPPRIQLGFDVVPSAPGPAGAHSGASHIRFWVRDNGKGIPAEAQKRLFTEFTRFEQMRATGHGLGLSIVKRIVEKLGGQVGVESIPGRGSAFFFTLPAAEATLPAYAVAPSILADTPSPTQAEAACATSEPLPVRLPAALLATLREALITADVTDVAELTQQVVAQDQGLGKQLETLNQGYDYAAMLELLERVAEAD